jgi:hypothetical protein
MIVPLPDVPMFILIEKRKIIISKNFERNFARNGEKMEFYFQSNSEKNSFKCPKAKSATHCIAKLFPFYQNKHWTIIPLY